MWLKQEDQKSVMSDDQDSQFTQMVNARLSRRQFLVGATAAGVGAFLAVNPITKPLQQRQVRF
ncbi:hypothetical protein JCM19231_5164 [Vibrio ishigakensis]|uniref:Twin-arginine translocation signal domain-containing protein n=1 Tax=Vibrio ishigakensis TaxID=1481914 RepID=A0A0B8NPT1_9VIBR|nr:hypothetical protein JCM19231_5164 [Vibrio ishigakensis]